MLEIVVHHGRCVLKSDCLIYLVGLFRTVNTWVRLLLQKVPAAHPVSVLPISYETGIHSEVQNFGTDLQIEETRRRPIPLFFIQNKLH